MKGGVDVKRGSQGGVRGRGFTLVELLVALGMIALLSAAMTVAVSRAQLRAKVSKATQEIREMTNAILAFEQYARGRTLANHVNGGWVECSEGNMRMILGGETGENGEQVPVLYNAAITGGVLRDPWGTPYQYTIQNTSGESAPQEGGGSEYITAPALPNFFRLTIDERGIATQRGGK